MIANVTEPAVLSLKGVKVRLGGREILRDVTATLQRGRITALIGLNGAGKSTLLKALLGEIPCEGTIRFGLEGKSASHSMGYVPQKLAFDARLPLTVREFFALSLMRMPLFLGIPRRTSAKIHDLLHRVGACHLIDSPLMTLSGGELQRVLLALALEPMPELLLLDEPAAGIDFRDQVGFFGMIAELNARSGITILLVSHDLSVVSQHAHHVLCLADGTIECQGAPSEILTPEMLARTFGSESAIYAHPHAHTDHAAEDCGHNHSHGW